MGHIRYGQCFSALVFGQRPRQGTKSCRMGRNSVRPSIRPSICPSVPPLACLKTLLAGPQTLLAGPQAPPASPQTPPAGLQTPLAGPQGLRASQQGLRVSQQGLRASQRGADGRMDGMADGWTNGISLHSTGLRPLPKKDDKNNKLTTVAKMS